jgi:hypothetical protein
LGLRHLVFKPMNTCRGFIFDSREAGDAVRAKRATAAQALNASSRLNPKSLPLNPKLRTFECLVKLPASLARQAKVAKLGNAIHHKDIVWLDVAMNEPLRVHKPAFGVCKEFRA